MQTQTAVSIENLTVTHYEKVVLWCVHAHIASGTIVGVMGPNGAGKSTLLKTMVGQMPPFAGTIRFFGAPFKQSMLDIAYIPQRAQVDWDFPITVKEVVLMGRYGHIGWFGKPKQNDYDLAYQALETCNIAHLADRHISQLSGGQQQRVFIARALSQQASIYLLDEPFVGIDIHTERLIMQLLKQLRDKGKTIIMVHHDLQTVTDYFDQLLFLNVKQMAYGPVSEIYTNTLLGKTFSQKMSIL